MNSSKCISSFYLQSIILFIILFTACKSDHKDTDHAPSDLSTFFSTLYNLDSVSLVLETDVQTLMENKDLDTNKYQPAFLTVWQGSEVALTTNIRVRPRGVTRKSICDFPPLMLKLGKSVLDSLQFRDTDNLKLVSHCKDLPQYRDYVHKEFLIYKLYNEVTDYSYKVKPVEFICRDSKNQFEDIKSKSFVFEPTDVMTQRLNCNYYEDDISTVKNIDKMAYKNFVVFQYMTGNTDWNLTRRHNIRMLECSEGTDPIPVPYDFDYSGLVNAEYAKPHPILPIKSVTERFFQFRGPAEEDFTENYDLFWEKKDNFLSIINNYPHLDQNTKAEMIAYIEGFYNNIASEEIMKVEIMKNRKKI